MSSNIIRPPAFEKPKSDFARAVENQPPALSDARLSGMMARVDAQPKMSAADAAIVATNFDRILRSLKPQLNLGKLCSHAGLGDGVDPKALYNYRASADGRQRKYVRDANKYLSLVEVTSKLTHEPITGLQRQLFQGSSYAGGEGDDGDPCFDCAELIAGLRDWIVRTTRLSEAFSAVEKYSMRVEASERSAGLRVSFGTTPFSDVELEPRVALFGKKTDLQTYLQAWSGQEMTCNATIQGTQEAVLVNVVETAYLSLARRRAGVSADIQHIQEIMVATRAGSIPVYWAETTQNGMCFSLSGGKKVEVNIPEVTTLWSQLTGPDADEISDGDKETLEFQFGLNQIQYLSDSKDLESYLADPASLRGLMQWAAGVTAVEPLASWPSHTTSYGRSPASQFFLALTGQNPHARDSADVDILSKSLQIRLASGRTPTGGWAISTPTAKSCSLPDLMWLLADEYAEAVLGSVAAQRVREQHRLDAALAHMRAKPV